MKPPKDFSAAEIAMYNQLKACGDNHSTAVDTVMGERLAKTIFRRP